jgi:hypothetical protein
MWGGRGLTHRVSEMITYPYAVNRWLSVRFNLLSALVIGMTGFIVVTLPNIDAALAGVALTFAMSVTNDVSLRAVLQ